MQQLILGFTDPQQPVFPDYLGFFHPYQLGMTQRTLVLELDDKFADEPFENVAEAAFVVTNLGEDQTDELGHAIYQAIYGPILAGAVAPIRSLSMGDTVTWEGRLYRCLSVGWEAVRPDLRVVR